MDCEHRIGSVEVIDGTLGWWGRTDMTRDGEVMLEETGLVVDIAGMMCGGRNAGHGKWVQP